MSANLIANGVKETSTTTGTAALVLSGAVSGFSTFAAYAGGVEKDLYYLLEWGTGKFERGFGHLNADGTLTRQRVMESSEYGVNLSGISANVFSLPAGQKTVSLIAPACAMVSVFPDTDDFDSAGFPMTPPVASDQRGTAIGIRASAGLDALAVGHGAVAALPGSIQLGGGTAVQEYGQQRYRDINNIDIWSIDHTVGNLVPASATRSLETVAVSSIETFAGTIDLIIRRPWTSQVYYAQIDVVVSSTVTSTLTVKSNTLGYTPTVALSMAAYDSSRAGAKPLLVTATVGSGFNVEAICKTTGVLIRS